MGKILALVGLVVAMTLFARIVGASEGKTLARAKREMASKNFSGARALLAAENEKTRSPEVLWLLAQCDLELEQWVEAANELLAYVATVDATKKRKALVANALLPLLEKKLGELVIEVPANVGFTIDDGPARLLRETKRIFVTPGMHVVHFIGDGQDAVVPVDVGAGARAVVKPRDPSFLLVAAKTEESMTSPVDPVTLPSTPVAKAHDSERTSSAKAPVVLTLGGLAVAAAVTGTLLSLAAHQNEAEAETLRAEAHQNGRSCAGRDGFECTDAQAHSDRASTFEHVATGCFAGAAAFGASAIVTHLLWPNAPVKVDGSASPDHIAANAMIRF